MKIRMMIVIVLIIFGTSTHASAYFSEFQVNSSIMIEITKSEGSSIEEPKEVLPDIDGIVGKEEERIED